MHAIKERHQVEDLVLSPVHRMFFFLLLILFKISTQGGLVQKKIDCPLVLIPEQYAALQKLIL